MKTKLVVILVILLVAVVLIIVRWAAMDTYNKAHPITNPALNDTNTSTSTNLNSNLNGKTGGKGGVGSGSTGSGSGATDQGAVTVPNIVVFSDPTKNITENANHISSTAIFSNGLKTTGLTNTLQSAGPFTVFAPTDVAFQGLDKITSSHISASNKNLTEALTYHIVPGRYTAADLKDGMYLKTTEGQQLRITVQNGQIFVNNAPVQTADIISSNGVMFIIGAVLVPAS